jgi:hypothetical protein
MSRYYQYSAIYKTKTWTIIHINISNIENNDLSNVHSPRRFKTIIANRIRLVGKDVKELVLLSALFPNTLHSLKPLQRPATEPQELRTVQ